MPLTCASPAEVWQLHKVLTIDQMPRWKAKGNCEAYQRLLGLRMWVCFYFLEAQLEAWLVYSQAAQSSLCALKPMEN